jgi:hypothetical protein
MFFNFLKVRVKQAVGEFGFGAVIKFLAPDFLTGIFLSFSFAQGAEYFFLLKVGLLSSLVSMFTLLIETRRLFFSGGDLENFYFVQSRKLSRVVSLSAIFSLSSALVSAVLVPAALLCPLSSYSFSGLVFMLPVAAFFSATVYLLIISTLSLLPSRIANGTLIILQTLMALLLLVVFQLSISGSYFRRIVPISQNTGPIADAIVLGIVVTGFVLASFLFFVFPFQEVLISKLNEFGSAVLTDMLSLSKRLKNFVWIRNGEEEAGFLFFIAQIFRNQSIRLSTIAIVAMPIMVTAYWSVRGADFIGVDAEFISFRPTSIAPFASLLVSGIMASYFMNQNFLSASDYEAKWILETYSCVKLSKFMIGFRKAFWIVVQVPTSLLVFFVIVLKEPFLSGALITLTFYLFTYLAAMWFFVTQKRLPFSLPFVQIGPLDFLGIASVLVYSFLVSIVIYFSYGNVEKILTADLFALVAIGFLKVLTVKIACRRLKLVR